MAVIIKSLADNQLTASSTGSDATYPYTPPSSPVPRSATVSNIRLVNADDAVTATVKIDCQTGTTSRDTSGSSPPFRKVAPINVTIPPNGAFFFDQEITLGAGDKVQITLVKPETGTAKLDIVISGTERDA